LGHLMGSGKNLAAPWEKAAVAFTAFGLVKSAAVFAAFAWQKSAVALRAFALRAQACRAMADIRTALWGGANGGGGSRTNGCSFTHEITDLSTK
jgi:hypothetical protein